MRSIIIAALLVFVLAVIVAEVAEAGGPGSSQAQKAIDIVGYGGRGRIAKAKAIYHIGKAKNQARSAGCHCAAVSYWSAKGRIKAGRWADAYTLLVKGRRQSQRCAWEGRS